MKTRWIDVALARELYSYDPSTGMLINRERDRQYFKTDGSWKGWNSRLAGKEAGTTKCDNGINHYRYVFMVSHCFYVHRIIWAIVSGDQPPEIIDHINGDSLDNRWKNLRDGTNGANGRNRAMRSCNTSGITGVYWSKRNRNWVARITVNRKTKHVGCFSKIEDAERAVKIARANHDYANRHGEKREFNG